MKRGTLPAIAFVLVAGCGGVEPEVASSTDAYRDDGWFIPQLEGYRDDGWFTPLSQVRVMQRSIIESRGGDPRLATTTLLSLDDGLDLLAHSGSTSGAAITRTLRGQDSLMILTEHPLGAWIIVLKLGFVATVGGTGGSCQPGLLGQGAGSYCMSLQSDCARPLTTCPGASAFGTATNDALHLHDFALDDELPVWQGWRAR